MAGPDRQVDSGSGPEPGGAPAGQSTKLVIAFSTALVAFGVRGWTGPVVILAIVVAIVVAAHVGRSLRPYLLATTPLIASVNSALRRRRLFPTARSSESISAKRIGPPN